MVHMDLDETKLREEIEFWTQYIEQWKASRQEPVHPIAVESLAHAEKKLQCYLMARNIMNTGKANGDKDQRSNLE